MRRIVLLALVMLAGCKGETEILVGFATDLKAKNQIDHVDFQAFNAASQVIEVSQSWDLANVPAGLYSLPGSFGVFSDGSEPTIKLDLVGSLGGQEIVRRESVLSPVSGQILFLRMTLVSECNETSGTQCPADQVCIEGLCKSSTVPNVTLPIYIKNEELSIDCDSGTNYIVSSTGAPMKPKGACPSGHFCLEGTCYKDPPGTTAATIGPSSWTPESGAPANTTLHGVFTTPDGDTFAVGQNGVILHLPLGGSVVDETFDPTHELWSVWGTSAGDVWAVGEGGVILHRSASGWAADMSDPSTDRLSGVWGSGGSVFAVGFGGGKPSIWHRAGGAWSNDDVGSGKTPLQAVWGSSASDVWAVGSAFEILHYDGTAWTAFAKVPAGATSDLLGVSGSGAGDVYFVGRGGAIAHLGSDGNIVTQTTSRHDDLFGVWSGGASSVYAVGDNGLILFSAGDGKWAVQESGTRDALFSVGGGGSTNVFATGRVGKLLRFGNGACTDDTQCLAGDYCAGNGQCAPQKAQGQACNADAGGDCHSAGCSECAGGLFCTDHVCCNAAAKDCSGCMQCAAPTGTCVPVAAGSDPHDTCPANSPGTSTDCQDSNCNGKGTCNKPDNTDCGTNSCMASALTTYSCESGACTANPATACAMGTACAAGGMSCLGMCTSDKDCAQTGVGAYCDQNGNCQTRKAQAGACNLAADCKTAGTCGECQSGLTCADGFCCNQACGGACEACDITPGSCTPVTTGDQPHHGTQCTGAGKTCGGACNSNDRAACTYPVNGSIGVAASCSDATTSVAAILCDGNGGEQNPNPGSTPCGAYNCDSSGDANNGLCYTACGPSVPNACSGVNVCSGTHCGLANNSACTPSNAGACASNFCANAYDGNHRFTGNVCCATACNTCTTNLADDSDTAFNCAGGTCDATATITCAGNLACDPTGRCYASCTQDSQCVNDGPGGSQSFCDTAGVCVGH